MHLRRILAVKFEIRFIRRSLPTDARADDGRGVKGVRFVDREAGIANGGARGHDRELGETIKLADPPRLEMRLGVEVDDLRRDARIQAPGRYVLDRPDARSSLDEGGPE